MSWVRVPPEAARKSDCLGCAILLCLVVCLTLLASFFLPSHLSLKHVLYVSVSYNYMYVCMCVIMNCVLQYYNVIFQPRRSSSSSKFTLASGTVATDDSKSHSLHRSQRYTCSDCTCAVHVSPFLFFLSPLTLSLSPSLSLCSSVSIPPSNATPQAELTDFKERLHAAAGASQLTPTPPSISVHTIESIHPQ